ncbi:MAG: carboxypeptidase-like regulatory domain-containing protein, partial [Candidatus Riflebacteria bacterium]|nr:carboxypeptidase-like regulatory domain-containing protein [Candidatus Riflebacteria bacterium]
MLNWAHMRNLAVLALVTILCVLIGCLGMGGGGGGGGVGSSVTGPVIPAGVLLSGRVYFAESSYYGGIPVLAKDAAGLVLGSTRTDSQGNFYFTDIPAGVYNLFASTGESEIEFFRGAQVISANSVQIPEKSLIEMTNVVLDQITSSSFRLRFESFVSTLAQVEYSTSTGAPSTVSSGNTYSKNHQVDVSGLVAGTRYGISIKLQAQDGQTLVYPVIYTTTSTSAGPTNLSVNINNGEITTRKLANRIYLNADGAAQMRVGTSEDLTSQPWETYSTFKDVTFVAGEGTRRVYVQFRDILGNLSGVVNDSILLQTDNTGYIGVWINNGEALTNQLDVILTILYPGAQQMQVSDRADFLSSFWEPYVTTRKMKISSGDGPKTVYVRFKGGNADESKSFAATIQLDTAGPQVEMLVNNGALKTNMSNVSLSFTYSKQPVEMQVQETNIFDDGKAWLKFSNPYKYVLPAEDGEKLIYVRFKDSLGNVSAVVEGRITLDTKAPSDPSLLINGGDEATNQLGVRLTLDVTADDGESVYMLISNNDSFAGATQERFSKTKAWTLGGYGLQTVYAVFYDDASNSTTILVESIEVEGDPPSSSSVKINDGDPSADSNTVSVSVTSDKATKIRIAEHENFSSIPDIAFVPNVGTDTMRFAGYLLSPMAGDKKVYVRMEDISGSFSISSDSIVLVGPSSYSISTIDTQPLSSFSVNLRPFAVDAAQMLITESFSQINDPAVWRPFVYSTVFDLEKYIGKHTIYAKYRNSGNVETPVLTLDLLVSEVTPATPAIILNLGDAVTTSSQVQVKVLTSGNYTQMQLSNDGTFYNSAVLPVTDTLWDITRSDGTKTVYARFFNPQSAQAEVVSDQITARGPASATLFTKEVQPLNKNWVQLELFADGATDMIVTEDPGVKTVNSGWLPYQTTLVYPLGDTTGQRTIYAKYRNSDTNWIESIPVQMTVTVNASSPTGNSVAFRATAAADSTRVVEVAPASMPVYLHFSILDAKTASISWKIVPGGAPVPAASDMTNEVVPVAPIPLTQASFGGYGIFNLYYQFSDGVGNKSAIGVTSIRIIDPDQIVTPTTGQITINYGDSVSESSRLNLNLFSSTASKVRVSSIESFSLEPDINYVADPNGMNITYEISPPTAGLKQIYARFESASGSFGFASDTITLVGPTNATMTVLDPLPLNKMWVELSLSAGNASRMLISENLASFTTPSLYWEPYSYRKVLTLENRTGTHVIYCKFFNSTTTWVETDLLQVTVSVNSTVPTGNDASFRATVASNSALITEITPASMPFYLHFNIQDPKTVTVSYNLVRADESPPVLIDHSLPILPVALNPGDFPGYGTFHLYYSFVDGVGNRSQVAIVPVKILEPGTEYSPVDGTVKINDGDTSTDRREVALTMFSETATRIKISQSETFSSVPYENYVSNTANGAMIKTGYMLGSSAGNKSVYVRFEDASGSFVVANDSIDLVGPLNYSLTTPDALPLSTFTMHLRPAAENGNEMLITEDYSQLIAGTGWASFAFTLDYTLQPFEGDHKIYARYRNAGNVETPVMTLDVSVYGTPPATPTILVNEGDVSVSQRAVTLRLFSENAASFTVSESLSFAGASTQSFVPANPDGSMFY